MRRCGSVDEIVAAVKKFADEHPDEEWIVGASYDGSLAPAGLFDARWLDAAVPDRPVVLRAWDYHTVWCNTAALERAGITADTPDPVLGEIPHRADGSVLGTLREWGATDLVTAVMPRPRRDACASPRWAPPPTTCWPAASPGCRTPGSNPPTSPPTWRPRESGALRMRFNLALYADPRHFDSQVKPSRVAGTRRAATGSPLLTANTVKFFADGVVENETGALLAPYCSGLHSHGHAQLGGRLAGRGSPPRRRAGPADPHPRHR